MLRFRLRVVKGRVSFLPPSSDRAHEEAADFAFPGVAGLVFPAFVEGGKIFFLLGGPEVGPSELEPSDGANRMLLDASWGAGGSTDMPEEIVEHAKDVLREVGIGIERAEKV